MFSIGSWKRVFRTCVAAGISLAAAFQSGPSVGLGDLIGRNELEELGARELEELDALAEELEELSAVVVRIAGVGMVGITGDFCLGIVSGGAVDTGGCHLPGGGGGMITVGWGCIAADDDWDGVDCDVVDVENDVELDEVGGTEGAWVLVCGCGILVRGSGIRGSRS